MTANRDTASREKASTDTLELQLGGLVAIHAARAVHTALGAMPEIVSATVTLAGATIDVQRPIDLAVLTTRLREALSHADVELLAVRVVQARAGLKP